VTLTVGCCLAVETTVNLAEATIVFTDFAVTIVTVPVVAVVREAQRVVINSARGYLEVEAQEGAGVHDEVGGRIDTSVGTDANRVFGGIEDIDADLVVVLGRVPLLVLHDVNAAESG
jgi:hypothetical protein